MDIILSKKHENIWKYNCKKIAYSTLIVLYFMCNILDYNKASRRDAMSALYTVQSFYCESPALEVYIIFIWNNVWLSFFCAFRFM